MNPETAREVNKHHVTIDVIERVGESKERIAVNCGCGKTLTSAFNRLTLTDINDAYTRHLVDILKPRKKLLTPDEYKTGLA